MNNHNTNFYSIEEVERTLKSTKEFEDGEQLYYFIGALRYLYDNNKEKDKEIERLNTEIDYLNKLRDDDAKELLKKDNIINELERILFSNKMYGEKVFEKSGLSAEKFKQQHPYTLGSYDNSVNLLDKLKELKENNK